MRTSRSKLKTNDKLIQPKSMVQSTLEYATSPPCTYRMRDHSSIPAGLSCQTGHITQKNSRATIAAKGETIHIYKDWKTVQDKAEKIQTCHQCIIARPV